MARSTAICVVSDSKVIAALNAPGKPVFVWRDKFAAQVIRKAVASAPTGKLGDAMHRAEPPGRYKAGFRSNRIGSNQHKVRANIFNVAPHAKYVEEGRRPSTRDQFFAWTVGTGWGGSPTGEWYVRNRKLGARDYYPVGWFPRTGARSGLHVLRNAFDKTILSRGLKNFTRTV